MEPRLFSLYDPEMARKSPITLSSRTFLFGAACDGNSLSPGDRDSGGGMDPAGQWNPSKANAFLHLRSRSSVPHGGGPDKPRIQGQRSGLDRALGPAQQEHHTTLGNHAPGRVRATSAPAGA